MLRMASVFDEGEAAAVKKTAIVSCYFHPNYGSMLQAFATQMALDKLGVENETIDISGLRGEIAKAKRRYFVRACLTSDFLFTKLGKAKNALVKKNVKNAYTQQAVVRAKRFETFSREHFRLSCAFSSKAELSRQCAERYDAVLVGSDQLWLPANIAADYFTLSFVPSTVNSIAYATSFGQSALPKDITQKASAFLGNIRHIGVREESGQRLVKELTGRNVPVVCDPVMLFTGEEWESVLQGGDTRREPYVLCYLLGANPSHREFARRLADETGCKLIVLPHIEEYVKADEQVADELLYDADPFDFVRLIRDASYVCTDSFHATTFSMLLSKRFFTFRRFSENTKQSTNSRIDTLLRIAGIEGRIFTGDEDVKAAMTDELDVSAICDHLGRFRESSYSYLKSALRDEKSTDL